MGVIFLIDQFLPNDMPGAVLKMPTLELRDITNSSGDGLIEVRHHDYIAFHNEAWYGMFVLAVFLLVLCSLLAGLTLALCGLDMTLVQLKTVSGSLKQREQAVAVASLKRRGTWMLCSLILCSVACGESLPIIVQGLWTTENEQWMPILISTLLVAVFAEVLPQYLIPKRAFAWGYYCWPLIWGCMWLTAIISYPLSWILDRLTGSSNQHSVFTNEDIAGLLKYHERSQKHGGMLGPDTLRIMLGALNLESHGIGGNSTLTTESSCFNGKDVEKASLHPVQGIVVKWSAVKAVDINEAVDDAFIQKVNSYSYSRLPVVGGLNVLSSDGSAQITEWDGVQIYGFLHVKNLVGLRLIDKAGNQRNLSVKDLPIYPLPIVQDTMAFYDLLNMFQLGMSRMAIVLPASQNIPWTSVPISATKVTRPSPKDPVRIAGEKLTGKRQACCSDLSVGECDWTAGFLEAAKATIDKAINHDHSNVGIKSPKPIGIVTFEDLIDTLLQKTSLDERDFFDRQTTFSPTKTQKVGDFPVKASHISITDNTLSVPTYLGTPNISLQPCQRQGTLIRRNVSNNRTKAGALDGADDRRTEKDHSEETIRQDFKDSYHESSYTQNSLGGFHRNECSGSYQSNVFVTNPEDVANFGRVALSTKPLNLLTKIASVPYLRGKSSMLSMKLAQFERHASAGSRPYLNPRVTSFSAQRSPPPGMRAPQKDNAELVLPIASMFCAQSSPAQNESPANDAPEPLNINLDDESVVLEDAREHVREKSGDTISLSTLFDDSNDFDDDSTEVYEAYPMRVPSDNGTRQEFEDRDQGSHAAPKLPTKQYDGFPMELLDIQRNKENQGPSYPSHTFPRVMDLAGNRDDFEDFTSCETTRLRERSFHDDRALLPSQRKRLPRSGDMSTRSSSFWF